jgi:peptidoglycan/LPS O-acetylase OafA/YrhL
VSATAAPTEAPSPAVTPPPGNPRFALFDSLRAIAVLAVLTFHTFAIGGAINRPVIGDAAAVLGSQGPILFFVISGFLLYRPYVAARAAHRAGPAPARYLRRRALRILPAYWLALTVLAIFPAVVGAFTGDWWRYYFFLQLYSDDTMGRGIPVAWTLCVEVSFYLLLPFWALAARRMRAELGGLAVIAAVGIAVQVAAARNLVSDLLATTILGQCTWLALGMALAVASVAVERRADEPRLVRFVRERPGACWLGAAAAFVAVTALVRPGGLFGIARALATQQPLAKTVGAIALGIALNVLLVAPAIFGERAGGLPRRVLAWAPLAWLGLVSYGVYLWHLTVTEMLGVRADPAHFSATGLDLVGRLHHFVTPILFVAALAVTTAIAALSYYLVELPFLRRKER